VRALSVRQPYAELIMRGEKSVEYRSRPTKIRELLYVYAAKKPG
jgi:predicted transcriptional regulator